MSFNSKYKSTDEQNQYMDSLVVKNQCGDKNPPQQESLRRQKSPRPKKESSVSWGIPLIAVLISGISLSGCVFLYFNAMALQREVDQLKAVLVGRSVSQARVQDSNQTGLVSRFDQATARIDRQMTQLSKWANFSGCVPGSDVVIG